MEKKQVKILLFISTFELISTEFLLATAIINSTDFFKVVCL